MFELEHTLIAITYWIVGSIMGLIVGRYFWVYWDNRKKSNKDKGDN